MSRQIDSLQIRDRLRARMAEFATRHHFVRDAAIETALRTLWTGHADEGGLLSEPRVEGAFPSEPSQSSPGDLGREGLLHPGLVDRMHATGKFPKDRPLFSHQLASLKTARQGYEAPAGEKPAIVVSAGTGAGKTESFLIPLLDDLYRNAPKNPRDGVSAIILYPMNALVNDQVGRLVEWLEGQRDITVFHFTGDTPERAISRGGETPDCAFVSREHARGNETASGRKTGESTRGPSPRILVTNYSMLEYMLCRPQDACFFGKNLRAIVLDEAHLYTGTLAAEIALLLRRVGVAAGVDAGDIVHYATSATLGDNSQAGRDATCDFAAKLFGKKDAASVRLITGARAPSPFPEYRGTPPDFSKLGEGEFPEDLHGVDTVTHPESRKESAALAKIGVESETFGKLRGLLRHLVEPDLIEERVRNHADRGDIVIGPFLRDVLLAAPAAAALDALLRDEAEPRPTLTELARRLFGGDASVSDVELQAVRRLLSLGALARKRIEDYPLIPNRIHLLSRIPDGVEVTWNPDFGVPVQGESFRLVSASAKPEHLDRDRLHRLSLCRMAKEGAVYLAGLPDETHVLRPVPTAPLHGPNAKKIAERIRYFLPHAPEYTDGATRVYFNPETGRLDGPGEGRVALYEVFRSHSHGTGADSSDKPSLTEIGFFSSSPTLYLSTLAHAALMEMPVYPEYNGEYKPAQGRRLLVFSDNRRTAAQLGTALTDRHEQRLFRAAVTEALTHLPTPDLAGLRRRHKRLENEYASADNDLDRADIKKDLEDTLKKIEEAQTSGGITLRDLPSRLETSERIRQLFHRPSADDHEAETWDDVAWNRNARAVGNADALRPRIAKELAGRAKWPDLTLETLVLAEIRYPGIEHLAPPASLMGKLLFAEDEEERFRNAWPEFLADLLDDIRTDGAITSGNDEVDREYPLGVALGSWMSAQDEGPRLIALSGATADNHRAYYVRSVLQAAGVRVNGDVKQTVDDVLLAVFETLTSNNLPWVKTSTARPNSKNGQSQAFRILLQELEINVPKHVFECEVSGEVRVRSVLGVNPARCRHGVTGPTLTPVTIDALDTRHHIGPGRKELIDSPLFKSGLWAEEHSAQLAQENNRRTQELFKSGIRNILSATTTLEMGIDIGGLQGVLLANIPPGKAGYLQRGGRAGRRADGSSLILGFARPTPYEQKVFHDFGGFLSEPFRKPTLLTSRKPLVTRHLQAFLFARFFRDFQGPKESAMRAFKNMGSLTNSPVAPYWEGHIPPVVMPVDPDAPSLAKRFAEHMESLTDSADVDPVTQLRKLAAGTAAESDWSDDALCDTFTKVATRFREAISSWERDYNQIYASWARAVESNAQHVANALSHQLSQLYTLTTIETLANRRFFPRYGFPIGISRLKVSRPGKNTLYGSDDRTRLERESIQSLREYVPGSTLLAGGRYITSRGILLHWTGQNTAADDAGLGIRGRYRKTTTPAGFDFNETGAPLAGNTFGNAFLIPRHGFTTETKTQDIWYGRTKSVGRVECHTKAFSEKSPDIVLTPNLGGVCGLTASFNPSGEILALNNGEKGLGFVICHACGFAESEQHPHRENKEAPLTSKNFRYHRSLITNSSCDCQTPLRHTALAAKFQSPMLRLESPSFVDENAVNAIAQALRLAGCRILELDIRELAFLSPQSSQSNPGELEVVLYETASGGAGHLEELKNLYADEWISEARRLLTPPTDATDETARRHVLKKLLTADVPCNEYGPLLDPAAALNILRARFTPIVEEEQPVPKPDRPDAKSRMTKKDAR